ncbi:DUF5957 family protein [Plantactinospora sp. GCM10030261]|uniref:DUF5957 family protein n=1 Tax=Plantactinospora sp. GCM10030261 TaxID=3273420 RepID=UPI003617CCFD
MKILIWAVIGAVGGLVFGLLLSEFIAITGMLLSERPTGVKFLPVYLAVAFAAVGAILAAVRDRRR